jgi:muramoyltetrapeptide carboxypeptidase
MLSPHRLKTGNYVTLAAPGRFVTVDEINDFTRLVKEWGLKVKIDKELFARHHQFAGDDMTRAGCLQKAMDDPGIKAIFCARGGYGSSRILEYINLRQFARYPKWIAGFSDITAIHAFLARNGYESVHALMPFTYHSSDQAAGLSSASLYEALFSGYPEYRFSGHELNTEGIAAGELIGGNLSVIYSLQATQWQFKPVNRILFIEDVDEYLYHIDRMMTNLRLSGFLSRLKGIIVGYMSDMHDNKIPYGEDAYNIIRKAVKLYKYPLCFGFPAGHSDPNNALVIGRKVRLEVSHHSCSLTFMKSGE